MKKSGLTISQLVDAYKKEVRSLLELAVPVWSQGITVDQSLKIERVQKAALSTITDDYNESYDVLLEKYKLQRLSTRRDQICKKFIEKNMKSESQFFKVTEKKYNTRSNPNLVQEMHCRTQSYFSSGLPFLARLYNTPKKN